MKANQPALLEEVQRLCDQELPTDRHQTVDVARSRHETRLVEVFDATGRLTCEEWQPFITTLIRVSRRRFERNAKTGLCYAANHDFYCGHGDSYGTSLAKRIGPGGLRLSVSWFQGRRGGFSTAPTRINQTPKSSRFVLDDSTQANFRK